MRSYLADEISRSDISKIDEFLLQQAIKSPIQKLYWVPLPPDLLTEVQARHTACQPHAFSVELGGDYMKMEFYIRSLNNFSCSCQDYCSPRQRAFILDLADRIIADLKIKT